ncbi:reverse transcriptase domain-containing protein, partial [Tanacetum coccineum]
MAMTAMIQETEEDRCTEGVVDLTQWLEKMESVFHISNCTVACQVKFATCTLQGNALTWWNSHVRTVRHDVAYAMPWKTLIKMMTDKYCPKGEIKKLETKMIFPEESDEIEKYVSGLPDMIHVSVKASKPKTMQEAIEFTTELMDKKILTLAERQAENKRNEKKEYAETLPLCNKCKFHHNGSCTAKCANCKRVGYLTQDRQSPAATNDQRTLTCYEYGNQGHYRSDFP